MRILKFFFGFVLVVTIVGLVGGLILRELLLLVGQSEIKQSFAQLRRIQASGQYTNDCLAMGTPLPDEPLMTYQIRFISDTEYMVEVVCNQFILSPIVVDQVSLKTLVKKLPGQSGLVLGDEAGGVVLEVLGRKMLVKQANGLITSSYTNIDTSQLAAGPTSSCSGYGFHCCLADYEQGLGDQLLGVTDCPKSCYSSCQDKPVILAFNSQPFFEPQTRELTIGSGQSVQFSYVASAGQTDPFATQVESENFVEKLTSNAMSFLSDLLGREQVGLSAKVTRVVVDFGDGEQQELTDLQGSTEHIYTCKQAVCRYQAKVWVENALGARSTDVSTSMISVVLN